MRDDAQHVLARTRHRLGGEAAVALALERARTCERASRGLREQTREGLIGRSERRRRTEAEHQSADELVAVH